MPARGWRKPVVGDVDDPDGLIALVRRYVDALRVKGYSAQSLVGTSGNLTMFTAWAFHRGVTRPGEVTKELLQQ